MNANRAKMKRSPGEKASRRKKTTLKAEKNEEISTDFVKKRAKIVDEGREVFLRGASPTILVAKTRFGANLE